MDYSQIIGAILASKKISDRQKRHPRALKAEDRFYKDHAKEPLPLLICGQIARHLLRLFTKHR